MRYVDEDLNDSPTHPKPLDVDNTFKIRELIVQVSKHQHIILFLDIDGTISEFHPNPAQSTIHPTLLKTIHHLDALTLLTLVTGRSVQQAQTMIQPYRWDIVGSHGLEYSKSKIQQHIDFKIESLNQLEAFIQLLSKQTPQLRIEVKRYSIALHFREHPELASVAKAIAQHCLDRFSEYFEIKSGKCVYELVPKGTNKGSAIAHIIEECDLHADGNGMHYYPIFIGDDVTDESGFRVINQFHGCSIKVGSGQTEATHHLNNVSQVQYFLEGLSTRLSIMKT